MRALLLVTTDYGLPDTVSSLLPPGWRVAAVRSAEDALQTLQGNPPDLLVVDGGPEEMAGPAFFSLTLDRLGMLPPVVYAGPSDLGAEDWAVLERAGVGGVLARPVAPPALEKAMAPHLLPPVLPSMRLAELVASALRDTENRLLSFQVAGAPMSLLLGGGYLETIVHASFRELWRARLTAAGYTLPPPRVELLEDLLFLEKDLPAGDGALAALKREAAALVLNSIPGGMVLRLQERRGLSRTPLLPIPLMPFLSELVARVPEEDLAPLRSPEVTVRRRTANTLRGLSLGPQEGFLLYQCEQVVRVEQLLQSAPGGAAATLRTLYLLLLLGAIETLPDAGEPPLLTTLQEGVARERRTVEAQEGAIANLSVSFDVRGQSPHQILGVPSDATYAQVAEAYETLQLRLAPENIHPRVRTRFAKDLNFLRAKAGEAFLMMQSATIDQRVRQKEVQASAEVHRIGGIKTEKQQVSEQHLREAERLFRAARELFDQGERFECQQYLKLALLHNPGFAPAHHLLGTLFASGGHSKGKHLAEKEFLEAVRLDPWEVLYLLDLAEFYLQVKLPKRSRTYLDQALKISPKSERANTLQKALRQVE